MPTTRSGTTTHQPTTELEIVELNTCAYPPRDALCKEAHMAAPQRRTESKHARTGGRPLFHPIVPDFHVRVAERNRLRVVEVAGEIDLLTAPRLAAALSDDEFDALVLDLGNVSFISSTGLGVIVSTHRRLSRRDGGLVLAAVGGEVGLLLEITGLDEVVRVAADVPTAIRLLADGR